MGLLADFVGPFPLFVPMMKASNPVGSLSGLLCRRVALRSLLTLVLLSFGAEWAEATLSARYVRVENPTSHGMSWQEVEVMSGGRNLISKQPKMVSGSIANSESAFKQGNGITDGQKDVTQRGPTFMTASEEEVGAWFEIDLEHEVPVDAVLLYSSRWAPTFREYQDKGDRVIALLNEEREVLWMAKWNCYDRARFPNGIFTFEPDARDERAPGVGAIVKEGGGLPIPADWLMEVPAERLPSDAEARMKRFTERNSPEEIKALADEFFRLLERNTPELEDAHRFYESGDYIKALDTWKKFWFARMERVNLNLAFHPTIFSYRGEGDDLLSGVRLTIGRFTSVATRFTPGRTFWVDIPEESRLQEKQATLQYLENLALVNHAARGLVISYQETGEPKYIERWAEIMDDWSMNFFADAEASRYNVTNFFVMFPADAWGKMMEEFAALAKNRPEFVELLPAATFARVQLACLEHYGPAFWRQGRETVFNHNTTAIHRWGVTLPYIEEFRPATRIVRERIRLLERWMTFGTHPDGSMTEVGDEGHFSIPILLSSEFKRLENEKPQWFTPGWRNRALEFLDTSYRYIYRHPAPGGFDHRFEHRIFRDRYTDLQMPVYHRDGERRENLLDRRESIFGEPEIRRIIGTLCYVSSGVPEVPVADIPQAPVPWLKRTQELKKEAQGKALAILGEEKPGDPHIKSDWMPYTGSYYFRSGWGEGNAFLAMLARNSRGGSEPARPSWSYGLVYSHDYGYPLMRAETPLINGVPQNPMGEKITFMPGTKTSALAYAHRDPAPHRWFASDRFAFGEALYEGSYRKIELKAGQDWLVEPDAARLDVSIRKVDDVRANRQIFQLFDNRLFIMSDTLAFKEQAPGALSYAFSTPFTLMLSSLKQGASKPFTEEQALMDGGKRLLGTKNPDGPNVMLYQFVDAPVEYKKQGKVALDFNSFVTELSENTGIAPFGVSANWQAKGNSAFTTLISSIPRGGKDQVVSITAMNRGIGISGFYAKLQDGTHLWFQASASGPQPLECGPARATAETLLVSRNGKGEVMGLVLGLEPSAIGLLLNGQGVASHASDFEFRVNAFRQVQETPIERPIAAIRFLPDRNVFEQTLEVTMECPTPGVEIHYTTDGTPPTLESPRYSGLITISETTEFAARAWRLGPDGKPREGEEFEINGTRFTVPHYGWFRKQDRRPAAEEPQQKLQPGLTCESVEGTWTRLYSQLPWLPTAQASVVTREMELEGVKSDSSYGARFKGFIRIPEGGVYTFHAPKEFTFPDIAASYDLRVFIDGEEWSLTQWWHGLGTWSIPLEKGLHRFEVHYADARTTPWRKSGLWRLYPRPWAVYQGAPSDLLVSGPGIVKERIPAEWLWRSE